MSPTLCRRLLIAAMALLLIANIPAVSTESSRSMYQAMRGLIYAVDIAILIALLQAMGGSPFRRLRAFPPYILALLAYAGLTFLWSIEPSRTAIRFGETAFVIVYLHLLFSVARQLVDDFTDFMRLLACAVVVVVAYGLLLNLAVAGTPLHYLYNPESPGRQRFSFGFMHPLNTGDILAMTIMVVALSPWRWLWKGPALAVFAVLLVESDATGARMTLIVLCGYLFVATAKDVRGGLLRIYAAWCAVLLAISADIITGGSRIEGLFTDGRLMTLTGRVFIWQSILDSGLAGTLFGTGYDASRSAIYEVFGRSYHAHNLYLSALVELGLIGLFLLIVVLVITGIAALRSQRPLAIALLGYVLVLGINNPGLLTDPPVIFMFWVAHSVATLYPKRSPTALRPAPAQSAAPYSAARSAPAPLAPAWRAGRTP